MHGTRGILKFAAVFFILVTITYHSAATSVEESPGTSHTCVVSERHEHDNACSATRVNSSILPGNTVYLVTNEWATTALPLNECFNAKGYEAIIDLGCESPWSRGYYHAFTDCFLSNFDLYEKATVRLTDGATHNNTLVVYPSIFKEFVNFFLAPAVAVCDSLESPRMRDCRPGYTNSLLR